MCLKFHRPTNLKDMKSLNQLVALVKAILSKPLVNLPKDPSHPLRPPNPPIPNPPPTTSLPLQKNHASSTSTSPPISAPIDVSTSSLEVTRPAPTKLAPTPSAALCRDTSIYQPRHSPCRAYYTGSKFADHSNGIYKCPEKRLWISSQI